MDTAFLDTTRIRRGRSNNGTRSVTDDQIDALLESGLAAADGAGTRPWHFVVIRDDALRKQVSAALRQHPSLERASVFVAPTIRQSPGVQTSLDLGAVLESMPVGALSTPLSAIWIGDANNLLWPAAEEVLLRQLRLPSSLQLRIPGLIALGP